MSKSPAPNPEAPGNLSFFVVLGLQDQGDEEWAKLRGVQFAALGKVTFFKAFAHVILALFVTRIYMETVPALWLLAWMAALAVLHVRGAQIDRSLIDADSRQITRGEFWRQCSTAVLSGILWGGAVVVFGPLGSASDLTALLLVLAIIGSSSIYFGTSAPLGTVLFMTFAGTVAAVHLGLTDQLLPMSAVLVFSIVTVLGAIQVGQSYLAGQLSKTAIAEKEEVVSLLLREFEENEADWLWEVDTVRRLRAVSPRFAFALGCKQSDAEGKPLMELVAGRRWAEGEFPPSLHELADKLKNRENFSNLLVHVAIRGEERWWELSGTPMRDERGRFVGFRGVGSDVTERRESDQKIAYLARYDTLTSLPNRLQLTEALGEALRYSEQWRTRCALLMVDLDRFKAVNDSLGHMTGDKLLAQVSARLQTLMDDNAICGRLGGDEFAIVVRD
ncbi:MAG: diguanylate cyclase, partial [Pseudomonadota bacterium]